MPRALRWSYGGGQFLLREVPLYSRSLERCRCGENADCLALVASVDDEVEVLGQIPDHDALWLAVDVDLERVHIHIDEQPDAVALTRQPRRVLRPLVVVEKVAVVAREAPPGVALVRRRAPEDVVRPCAHPDLDVAVGRPRILQEELSIVSPRPRDRG
eukprot:CAMPEP_0180295120 /NCGR_PEP_ID=MMETSP0988-20121125/18749_1 /TAXON_ID=697907 /ORGANISM="non described non described, Strain CCMP2293" /LENGTH=157 /DNA_ID=CAMNT_0022272517 /DNA_START=136 /DNA_END=605 /DNA_ORIENTATION=-